MKLATVGTSEITNTFLSALKQDGTFTYEAAYSRSIDKARTVAASFGAARAYDSFETLAENQDIDVVYVASPNGLHFQHVSALLRAGKHVICEKPMFTTLKEFDTAFKIADEQGVYLFEAIRNIQTPVFRALQARLERAGTVRSAVFQLIQYSSRYDRFLKGELTNIFSPEFAGGALEDLGVYTLYPIIALFGRPKHAAYYPVMLSSGVDGSGTLVLTYNGFVCTLLCSKIAHSSAPSEIHGERGTWRINNPSNIHQLEWIDAHTKDVSLVASCPDSGDMIYEIARFGQIIGSGDQPAFQELRALGRDVLATMESVRLACGIRFPSDDR
ncbi:MAG: Gfo/Idh/MocA family oxidoreductase [Sporolactobacillus sp.]